MKVESDIYRDETDLLCQPEPWEEIFDWSSQESEESACSFYQLPRSKGQVIGQVKVRVTTT